MLQKKNNKLCFKNLTLAPIDLDLVDFKMLNNFEKRYLKEYHKTVYRNISKYLLNIEKKWLRSLF